MTDTSSYTFNITTDAGSYAGNRFYVIFDQAPPVAIIAITATRNNNTVAVNWRVEHEAGITQYELQKSTDGNNFSTISLTDPFGNNTGTFNYTALDQNPSRTNYYRVKGLKTDGTQIYSAVVRVGSGGDGIIVGKNQNAGSHIAATETPATEKAGINIYPNPVVDKILNVQFLNQVKGTYKLELVNKLGQTVYSGTATVNGINQSESIHLNANIVAGIYQLKIKSPVSETSVQQVIIQ
ncbi:MAG: T9SS type A sorting domain-containing protein [Ferruginibacter sp.]